MTFELNKFADRTEDEFRNTILMRPQGPPIHPRSKFVGCIDAFQRLSFLCNRYLEISDVGALPDSFDWRDHNAVTAVKDQGRRNSGQDAKNDYIDMQDRLAHAGRFQPFRMLKVNGL